MTGSDEIAHEPAPAPSFSVHYGGGQAVGIRAIAAGFDGEINRKLTMIEEMYEHYHTRLQIGTMHAANQTA